MKTFYLTFFFLLYVTTLTIAQETQDNCFDEYYDTYKKRGAYNVPDGMQRVVVGIKDRLGRQKCDMGQIMVKENKLVLPLYFVQQDGSLKEAVGSLDKNFYHEMEGQMPWGVTDGMTATYMLTAGRQVRLFFMDYLKPESGGRVKAPDLTPKEIEKITINAKAIQFETGKDILTTPSNTVLDSIVAIMLIHPDTRWVIDGYTDNVGNDQFNMTLSQKRADAVKVYFTGKGINRDMMTAVGHGSSDPLADNSSEEGRAMNRRVEIRSLQ